MIEMSDNIKFNVIIPTRERPDTLLHCLRTVVAQDYENLEIIVSDNCSQDNTKEVVDSFADPRIRYLNTGKRVSMSHNWEFALGHVTGGWVTVVGDDDGLLPGALAKIAGVIRQTGCQAVTSKWCYYSWPRSTVADNRLIVPLTAGFEIRESREWLAKLMHGNAVYPELPYLYTGGFVNLDAINRARAKGGEFFRSMIPDVYSAIALASVMDTYVMLNEPVAIAGTSSHSNGASTLGLGQNVDPAKKFFSEGNIPFYETLAGGELVKSIPVLVYESYLQSIHLHQDWLHVQMPHQLALALARARPQNFGELMEYCLRIAQRNGVTEKAVMRRYRREKLSFLLGKVKDVLRRVRSDLVLDGADFGIGDVNGAASLARSSYVIERQYAHWKRDNLVRIIRQVMERAGLAGNRK
jgi:glycosyltransferase involved in cell wall biosynthesis